VKPLEKSAPLCRSACRFVAESAPPGGSRFGNAVRAPGSSGFAPVLLKATSRCSEGISVVMWIGRVGSGMGSPCALSAPEAASTRSAVTWCVLPADPIPGALSLEATKRMARCMRPGVMHVRWQSHRTAPDQGGARDIDIILGQLRPSTGVARHSSWCGLR